MDKASYTMGIGRRALTRIVKVQTLNALDALDPYVTAHTNTGSERNE